MNIFFVFAPLKYVLLTHILMGKRHIYNYGKDTLIERVFSTFINGENTRLYMWKIHI